MPGLSSSIQREFEEASPTAQTRTPAQPVTPKSPLPRGTVTFLFTDIEGSTRLAARLGERYAEVLADHQRLLREAFDRSAGREIDTQGDAFFVVFTRAKDAVAAALSGERALVGHRWPEGLTVRVRMGLHTGEPSTAHGRYIGLGVHRAARICAAAHGGQILLSSATYALLADDVLPDITFHDLGEHRLKDLERPERLYQLIVPDLPRAFPPPRTLPADTHQVRGRLAVAPTTSGAKSALRVVVADDSVLVREGLTRLPSRSMPPSQPTGWPQIGTGPAQNGKAQAGQGAAASVVVAAAQRVRWSSSSRSAPPDAP